MKLCFFTMANNKRYDWAHRLILSGEAVKRPIWFFRIPDGHPDPKRYKIELLMGDLLSEADKYIYLDSDVLMLQHGDWESEEAYGAVSEEKFHISSKNAFSDEKGYKAYCDLFAKYNYPTRVNTGVVVLPGSIRKQVGERWKYWCEYIESLCELPMKLRDQPQFPFVMCEFKIPVLPDRFCAIIKRESVRPDHIALHASGHPRGDDLNQYISAANKLLGEQVVGGGGKRWHVLTKLIIQYAPNPTYPVGAEVGVYRGENAFHLLDIFPGLKLHCIDNRKLTNPEKHLARAFEDWERNKRPYMDRIIEHTVDSDKADLPAESLDYVFIDADHRTDAVVKDIKHYLPLVKKGGFIAGHDIDYRGTYYGRDSVRNAVTAVFGNDFQTGADYTWWHIKK